MAPTPCPQRAAREPLYDINRATGVCIEVFYLDRRLETFGRGGAGWFWWYRLRGCSPDGSPTGPFASRYSAFRHAMIAAQRSAMTQGEASTDPQR